MCWQSGVRSVSVVWSWEVSALGGSVSIGKSMGGMSTVRCKEFVCFSEGPLLEVLLYCS